MLVFSAPDKLLCIVIYRQLNQKGCIISYPSCDILNLVYMAVVIWSKRCIIGQRDINDGYEVTHSCTILGSQAYGGSFIPEYDNEATYKIFMLQVFKRTAIGCR